MSSARDSIVADGEGHSAAVAPTSKAEQHNVAETPRAIRCSLRQG